MEIHHLAEDTEGTASTVAVSEFSTADFISGSTFLRPEWLKASEWMGHVPFAFWVMEALKPRSFVELGTHNGTSYAAFCQSVQNLGIGTKCFAVDTWEGAPQAGFYGGDVYENLAQYNQRHAHFSRLIRSTFNEALTQIDDGSVDLLHIDGLHTYEAVKNDFETWLPKLSSRAVVLFHDTNVYQEDFGVHQFWGELKKSYPTFEFLHAHGLGIAGIGTELPDMAKRLFLAAEKPASESKIRHIYARLGDCLETEFAHSSQLLQFCKQQEQLSACGPEMARLRWEIEMKDERLSKAGAALRAKHFEIVKLQCNGAPFAHRVWSAERKLRTWLGKVSLSLSSSGFSKAITQFFLRQQRSIKKRKNKLRCLLNPDFQPQSLAIESPATRNPPPALFDERYYKSQARTKRPPKTTCWEEYQQTGWKLGINPHPLFDVKWYLATNPDVKATGEEPFTHYLNTGWKKGLNPNAYFQTDWYIANNQKLLKLGIDPLMHYLEIGWKNGRDPGPKFSIKRFFEASPHAEKIVDPLSEFMEELTEGTALDIWPTTYVPSNSQRQPIHHLGKIAVQLHAFYLDKLDVIFDHLKYIPVPFDLLVSTDTDAHASEIKEIVARAGLDCALDIRCTENRGRDVAPFICVFGKKLLDYDYALHIHTKKSMNVQKAADHGHNWLMHNLGFLLRNPDYVNGLLSLFYNNPKCGVLTPKPWKGIRNGMTWTSNKEHAETLMERLQLPKGTLDTQPLMFPGGTMFWFRPAALKPLLASDLRFEDFPAEPLPKDGTVAHAIERCILYIALSQGYHSLVVAPSIYKPIS